MDAIYTKLGDVRVKRLVDLFYEQVFISPTIGKLFANSDQEIVKDKQYRFLTQFLGGPTLYINKYGSPKMRQRHFPHQIDNAAKDEWLALMKNAINQLDIDDDLKVALYNCFPKLAAHMVNS